MSRRTALLIVNRHSRRGGEAADLVVETLREFGLTVREEACDDAKRLPDLIDRHAAEVDCIVIGGGDGTLNAALPGLLRQDKPLGVIPLGTANDLARTLDIPVDPREAARVVVDGVARAIDVGEANGHPFLNVASVGFGVDLTRALTRDAKKRWGVFGYAVAGVRTLSRTGHFLAEIEQDGTVQTSRTIHLAVGNGRHYGGGMTVSETAAIDDGHLNVYSLEVRAMWRLLLLLPAMRRGDHGRWQEVRTLSGQDITVRTRRPRSVNTDGEITTQTPVRFRVRPGALSILVPRREVEPAGLLDASKTGR